MLKIWLEFIFSHVIPPLFLKNVTNHSVYLCSAAFRSILRQIGQCWKFGQNSSSVMSYLHYSSKLGPTTQHTFVPLHFATFWGKSDNVENLVGIHLWSFIPLLFFKTVANHSVYLHSAAFCSILGQMGQCWKFGQNSSLVIHTSIILQKCGQLLSILSFCCYLLHFETNQTMLKIWLEFIFDHIITFHNRESTDIISQQWCYFFSNLNLCVIHVWHVKQVSVFFFQSTTL